MLKNIGAKFIGRAAGMWGTSTDIDGYFEARGKYATLALKADPEFMLQCSIFEAIHFGQIELMNHNSRVNVN